MPAALPSPASVTSYKDLISLYDAEFQAALAAGTTSPIVVPYRLLSSFLLFCYLLIPPTRSRLVYYARFPIFAFHVYWSVKTTRECRSGAVAMGYLIGLINGWGIAWGAAVLIFIDGRSLRRIERREVVEADQSGSQRATTEKISRGTSNEGQAYGHIDNSTDASTLRARHVTTPYGKSADLQPNLLVGPNLAANSSYVWQTLPTKLSTRFFWALDLATSFRGLGWSYQISSLPSPPPSVLSTLAPSTPPIHPTPSTHRTGTTRYPTTAALLTQKLGTFALSYIVLDTLKVMMMNDPYFWGTVPIDAPLPSKWYSSPTTPSYLPSLLTASAPLTRVYRLFLSLVGTYAALQIIFALSPLFFTLLLPLLYPAARTSTRLAPWQYPDFFGSYRQVLAHGLRGWWGSWWHQTFRHAFQAPAAWITARLGLSRRSTAAQAIGLIVAFGLSGGLHALASYTIWPRTQPLSGPGRFFCSQIVGIGAEICWHRAIRAAHAALGGTVPAWMGSVMNFVWVHVWGYWTAAWLVDDFARGGIWLFEPVPVSLWRGLGLGLEGAGWWCWPGPIVWWHRADRWWESGLAF